MAIEYCPRCGNARTGSFRFCRSCQYDFEATSEVPASPVVTAQFPYSEPAAPAGPVPAAVPTSGYPRSWIVVAILAMLGLAVVGAVIISGAMGSKTPGVSAQDAPPAGLIWFGTAYDPSTFALTNRGTSFVAQSQIALVADLNRAAGNERVTIYTTVDGIQLPAGYGQLTAGEGLLADIIPGAMLATPGPQTFTVEDSGGNKLASGTITVTP